MSSMSAVEELGEDLSVNETDKLKEMNDEKLQSKTRNTCIRFCIENKLIISTVVAVIIGFSIGLVLRCFHPSADALLWLGMLGELYLRLLKMMVVPLIFVSVLTSTASMDPKCNGKISVIAFLFIFITNCLPTILGSSLVLILKPGENIASSTETKLLKTSLETQDIFADLLRNIIPDNIITSTFEKTQTIYSSKSVLEEIRRNGTNSSFTNNVIKKEIGSVRSSNILGLVVVSAIFGMSVRSVGEAGKPFLEFMKSFSAVVLQTTTWFILTTPLGVVSLIAKTVAGAENIEEDFKQLGMFFVTVMLGLLIMMYIIVPIVYFLVTKRNPFKFIGTMMQPSLVVFSTSSTLITVPESLKCLEELNEIDKRVTRFVVPLCATLSRAGSALFIVSSCLFIAQMFNIELDAVKVTQVCLLTSMSTFAIPPVGSSAVLTVIIIITAMEIPAEEAALLYTLEWFLDRFRAVTNIYYHLLGTVITFELVKRTLPPSTLHTLVVDDDQTVL